MINHSAPNHGPHANKDTSTASQWMGQFGPLKIESGCQERKVYSNGTERLVELVPRPAIALQKPPRTGHVSDSVYSGRSLTLEEGSTRLLSESQLNTIAGQI